jgi:hypothetical protein
MHYCADDLPTPRRYGSGAAGDPDGRRPEIPCDRTSWNHGRDHPFVRPMQSPSFRPDPRVLRLVAHRVSQGWPLPECFSAHYIFRPLLDWPEHDGKLGRVGA